MENIFRIGDQVQGKSFIGRKEIVKEFKKDFIETKSKMSKALIGLPRIGKTSIALNVFKDVPDDICYVFTNLNEWSTYEEVWQDICFKIEDYLKEHSMGNEDIFEAISQLDKENILWIKLNRNIKKIFEELYKFNIKTILVLDEFDKARDIFSETKHFELFRELFSSPDYNISGLTISRRNIHTIENTTYQSSTFHGVLDVKYLTEFNDNDMEEFYSAISEYGVLLTDEVKNEIESYTGKIPYLLSTMAHYLVEDSLNNNEIDITSIFNLKCKTINDYYRDCVNSLKADGDLKRIVPFVIGPNIGVNKNDKDELVSLGYLKNNEDKTIAISDYFVNFLSNEMMNISIWDNIINLEKVFKQLLRNESKSIIDYYKVGGEDIKKLQRSILSKVEDITLSDIARYDSFVTSCEKLFAKNTNYFDVISLNDTIKIVKQCWDNIFSKYFNNSLYMDWDNKLQKCIRARNPVAHGHEEYLSPAEKNEVDVYCKEMIEIINTNLNGNRNEYNENDILEYAKQYPVPLDSAEINYSDPIDDLVGRNVSFKVIKIGGNSRNNLSGIVDEKYKGTIPANYLKNVDLNSMVDQEIYVYVEKIDGDHYILQYHN